MAMWLRQSTAVDVSMGPFVDSLDGNTVESGLTITQPDIRLKKASAAWAQKNAAQTLSHEEAGWYEVALDTTDTDTLGNLLIAIHESGALPVWREFQVVPANVWDSLFGADKLQVHADEITAGLITATAIANGAIDAATFAAGAIDAAALATDAVTEIQSGLATAAALATVDGIVDAILLDTAEIGTAGAGLTAITDQTDNLPPDPADASVIAALIDALPTAAENAAAVATTAMTEAYSADGGTVTLAQGIYELLARDQEISISGATMTVKKRDGSTTAYTLTLNDADSPTSVTRSA